MNKYNTFSSRFFAALADWVIIFLILWGIGYLKNNVLPQDPIISKIHLAFYTCFDLAYFIFLHGKYGQSIGKMIMNVKIVSFPDESPITYKQAILRDLPYLILIALDFFLWCLSQIIPAIADNFIIVAFGILTSFAAIIWFILEIITMLTNGQRRAVQDKIASTVVVDLEASELKIEEMKSNSINS
jgi:uncharacterized RDD family membrane protein YckC